MKNYLFKIKRMKRFREISKVNTKKKGGGGEGVLEFPPFEIKIGYLDFNIVLESPLECWVDLFPYCDPRVWL